MKSVVARCVGPFALVMAVVAIQAPFAAYGE
jgi:hypothetical protein